MSKGKLKTNQAKAILDHPDLSEIVSKLLLGISPKDISEWLDAKYSEINDHKFAIPATTIKKFQDEYLDIYTQIKSDLEKVKSPDIQLREEIQGSSSYHKALEKYIDNEIDIKTIVKKMVANVETRLSQMYDIVQEDPRNFKADRTMLEWCNSLLGILEKYHTILNPPDNSSQDQINIQNNINIQVLDTHMNAVYDIIREILTMLDYDTSLVFIERFQERIKQLKVPEQQVIPIEHRLNEAKKLEETVQDKLDG